MKNNWKSLLAGVLALVMLLSCTAALAAEDYTFPLVDEKLTLTAFTPFTPHMTDPSTNRMNLTYEEKTNVHIEWTQSQDYVTDLNLMLASDENVDLWLCPLSTDQVKLMVEAGRLMPLNDLIEQYAPNISRILEERPDLKANLTATDGNIYTLFQTDVGVHMPNRRKMFVKADWLEAYRAVAGEKAPSTWKEFEEMLVFFRDNDMNGNGEKDEIPLMASTYTEDDPIYYLMSAFQQISNNFFHLDDNGKVVFEATADTWREGLRWMNHLYEEGLFYAEETYVQDRDQLRAVVNVADPSQYVVGAIPTFWEGRFVDLSVLGYTDFMPIEPVAGEDGVRRATITQPESFKAICAISAKCSDPVTAIKWLDWWMSDEGSFAHAWGMVEDTDYEWVDAPSISGEAKSIKALADSYNDNFRFGEEATPKMDSQKIRYAATLDESTFNTNNSYVLYRAGKMYEPYYVPSNVPAVVWCSDADLIAEMNEYRSVINDMVRTAYTEFILGLRDLDTEWDSYLAELNDAGLEQYIEDMNRYYAN